MKLTLGPTCAICGRAAVGSWFVGRNLTFRFQPNLAAEGNSRWTRERSSVQPTSLHEAMIITRSNHVVIGLVMGLTQSLSDQSRSALIGA